MHFKLLILICPCLTFIFDPKIDSTYLKILSLLLLLCMNIYVDRMVDEYKEKQKDLFSEIIYLIEAYLNKINNFEEGGKVNS